MAIVPKFRDAQRRACKAAILIEGISGRGKTGLALAIAHTLAEGVWEAIYAVDTENKSMDLYLGDTLHTGVKVEPFKIGDLTHDDGYKPSHYAAWRDAAVEAGAKVLISDSISHMWTYKGGVLDMVSALNRANKSYNKYSAWGEPEVVAEKNQIMDLIRSSKLHVINTVRTKEKQEMIPDETKGGFKIQSLGEQQIMMPDLKYEPDLVLTMVTPGHRSGRAPVVKVSKSRYPMFELDEEYEMTTNMILQMKQFLEEGTSPEELIEHQRQDYIQAVTEYLNTHPNVKNIWPELKNNLGVKDMPLKSMPLNIIKQLFSSLVAE